MKFLDKLGLAIFSMITLVISIVLCLIIFGWMEPTIFSILIGKVLVNQTYSYIMLGVCIFLIILAIRCIFLADPNSENDEGSGILLQNEDGKLLITSETLENMVEGVINDIPNITESVTNVIITKENDIVIETEINIAQKAVIVEVSSKLQSRIKKAIKEATGLEIKYVNVSVKNAENVLENEVDENAKEEVKDEVKDKEKNEEKEEIKEEVKENKKKKKANNKTN